MTGALAWMEENYRTVISFITLPAFAILVWRLFLCRMELKVLRAEFDRLRQEFGKLEKEKERTDCDYKHLKNEFERLNQLIHEHGLTFLANDFRRKPFLWNVMPICPKSFPPTISV